MLFLFYVSFVKSASKMIVEILQIRVKFKYFKYFNSTSYSVMLKIYLDQKFLWPQEGPVVWSYDQS